MALAAAPARAALPHHDLQIRIDPSERTLAGTDVLRLDPPRAVTILIGMRFAVQSIVIDGKPIAVDRNLPPPSRETAAGMRRIAVPTGARVEIAWRGTLEPLDESLGHRDTLGDARPVAGDRGTFLPAQSGWYPAVSESFATYRATVDVPDGHRALVPGRITGEQTADGRHRATFDFPHPGRGIDLVAGPYRVDTRRFDGPDGQPIELRTYFHAEIAELAPGYLEAAERHVRRYAALLGPYPFGTFSIVSSPTPTGFGMPAFTYLGIQVLRLPFIRDTSLAHEVLHCWLGNGVYVDYGRGNWSEGLTTFLSDYATSEARGARDAWHDRLAWLQEYASIAPTDDFPLARFTARSHGASQTVGYGKTAMVFLMLRDRIGREAFERGLRRFWERERFRIATWSDLRAAFEEASGSDLRGFFAQWVDRVGAPTVRIVARTPRADGVEITLEQSSPPYALAVPVRAGERAETIDLQSMRRTVLLRGVGADAAVTLDPDLRVFRRLAPGEAPPLLRQIGLARDVGFVVATPALATEARAIGTRLVENGLRPTDDVAAARRMPAVLVVGLDADVGATLDALGVSAPAGMTPAGSGRAFAAWSGERLVGVVTARDREALAALTRPLPFYGRYGWVTFDGARVAGRGIGP
jgi:hypothetical protein